MSKATLSTMSFQEVQRVTKMSLGRPVFWSRETGKGSDYLGPCDCCGKHMSEAHALMRAYESDGRKLAPNAIAYGHPACISQRIAAAKATA